MKYAYTIEVWNCFANNSRFELVGVASTEAKARDYLRGSQFSKKHALITRLEVNSTYDRGIGCFKHWHINRGKDV